MTNSEPSSSRTVKRSTRTKGYDRDHSANAASASATADPASATMMSPTVLQHNLADHAKAAALQAAADAAAAAATDPKILRAVLLAAAATANALASTIGTTGRCANTPTRRKAAQDEEGESPTQATQDPEIRRPTSAKSDRHSHCHAVPKDPAGSAQSTNRQQPFEGRTKPAAARSTVHQQQPCRQLRYACDPLCPAPEPSCDTSEWQGHC